MKYMSLLLIIFSLSAFASDPVGNTALYNPVSEARAGVEDSNTEKVVMTKGQLKRLTQCLRNSVNEMSGVTPEEASEVCAKRILKRSNQIQNQTK